MARLTYTNERGQSLIFGDSAPILVTKIDGLGAPKNEIQRQKSPYQDGTTETGSTLGEREIYIEGVILASDRWPHRQKLLQVFNPKLKGLFRYENGSVVKEIWGKPEIAPNFPSNMQEPYQMFSLVLLCPNPFLLDPWTESREIVTWIGGLSFPLRLSAKFSMKGPKKINIVNHGDVETPVRIEFKGPATNPKIINHTVGGYIQVNRTLQKDDALVVSTDFGAKRVEINGVNAFNWIDLGSTFWMLRAGDNVVEYTSNDDIEPAAVAISYCNRYVGI